MSLQKDQRLEDILFPPIKGAKEELNENHFLIK
jgi:hypothetical protein